MRATEIIRSVLDIIDQIECSEQDSGHLDPISGSFSDIFAQLSQQPMNTVVYDNSPDQHVQGIASVTTAAGGGWNGPKNPADHRADSVSMYPNYQAKE